LKATTVDGGVISAGGTRAAVRALFDPVVSHARSVRITGQVIWALMLRKFRADYGHRKLGVFWAFLPPLFTVAFFVAIFTVIKAGQAAPIGHDPAPFIALGLMNLQFYRSVLGGIAGSLRRGKSLLIFPRVKVYDLYIAAYLLEVAILVVVFTVFMAAFIFFGLIPMPEEFDRVLLPLLISSMLGVGVGYIHAVLSLKVVGWAMVWTVIGRIVFLTSGLFFVADGMPLALQEWLYYNPILHLTEWLRSGYYANYESRFLDPAYPLGFMLAVLLLGFAAERVFRADLLRGKVT
jgi:capsular polysaccharide transport system permease protein